MSATDAKLVFFSVEPTCFGTTYEQQVINISACGELADGVTFNVYVKPTCRIMPSASERCGLRVEGDQMYLNDVRVDAVDPNTALHAFIEFIHSIGKQVILVSYGSFYDAEKIVEMAISANLIAELQVAAIGFVDLQDIYKYQKGFLFPNHLRYFAMEKLNLPTCPVGTALQRILIIRQLYRMDGELSVSRDDLTANLRRADIFIRELQNEEGGYVAQRFYLW